MENLKKYSLKQRFMALIGLAFVFVFSVFLPFQTTQTQVSNAISSAAPTVKYSNALDDLRQDSSFDATVYPKEAKNYSLKLVQIAESSENELFVYVYQPSATENVLANEIRMSVNNTTLENNQTLEPHDFELMFLNRSGTLFKYLVKNYTVQKTTARSYDIIQLSRAFNSALGDSLNVPGNTASTVPYKVGQTWTVFKVNDQIFYSCKELETITITNKFVGYVRYEEGFRLFQNENCDAHFIAFSTDKPMDKLISATVEFSTEDIYFVTDKFSRPTSTDDLYDLTFTDHGQTEALITDRDSYTYTGKGFKTVSYSWDRIQTVSQFMAEVNEHTVYEEGLINVAVDRTLTSSSRNYIKNCDWVLNFYETSAITKTPVIAYNAPAWKTGPFQSWQFTRVYDTSILRLEFEYDGKVYNLGVVDNKQTGSIEPVTTTTWKAEVAGEGWKKILNIIILVLILIVGAPLIFWLLKTIIELIITFFKWFFGLFKKGGKRK